MLGEPQQSAGPAQQSELTQVPEQLQLPQKTLWSHLGLAHQKCSEACTISSPLTVKKVF